MELSTGQMPFGVVAFLKYEFIIKRLKLPFIVVPLSLSLEKNMETAHWELNEKLLCET